MNAIPWYQSRVYIGAVVAIISQIIVLLGKQDVVPVEAISTNVEAAFQLIALVATGYAAWKRQRAVEQPLTLTKTGAEKFNQGGFARPLMLAVLLAIAVPIAAYLPGCTSIPVQQMSIDQRIKAAYDTHTLVTQTVDTALNTHLISSRDAEQYLVLAGNARSVLDSAWALRTSDISTAEGQLQLANDILIELQKFLISRGEK